MNGWHDFREPKSTYPDVPGWKRGEVVTVRLRDISAFRADKWYYDDANLSWITLTGGKEFLVCMPSWRVREIIEQDMR